MQCKAAAFESGSPSCLRARGLQGGSGGSWRCDDALRCSEHCGGAAGKQGQHISLLPITAISISPEGKERRDQAALTLPHVFQKKTMPFPPSFSPVLIPVLIPPPFPCSFCGFFFVVFMSVGQHFPWGRSKNQPNTHPAHSNGKNHSSSVLWHSPHMGSTSPLQRSQAPNQAQPEQL